MKKSCFLSIIWTLLALYAHSQNIAINADGSRPDANAILDIKSTNKGLLIPRLTTDARMRIANTRGMMVYDITTDNFWYNTGKEWKCIPSDDDRGKKENAWLLTGNSRTRDRTNFLGTIDNVPFTIRVNNQLSARLDSSLMNSFWGYLAGNGDTSGFGGGVIPPGINNTAVGFRALSDNLWGSYNTAVGSSAFARGSGDRNTATGYRALGGSGQGFPTPPSDDVANGYLALGNEQGGAYNTAMGSQAMFASTQGVHNTAVGYQALGSSDGAYNNTAVGSGALRTNGFGVGNTAVGFGALFTNDIGYGNTGVGSGADVASGNLQNATAIGAGAIVDASNKVRIGNSSVTVIEGQVPFTTPSDGRFKFNVREDVQGLAFILQLRPVTYQFDVRRFDARISHPGDQSLASANYAVATAYENASRIRRTGFIAQEVEQAAAASGYDFSGIIKPGGGQDHYSLSYDAFVVPLVKAVQEQQKIIAGQNNRIEEQERRLAGLEQQIAELKKMLK